MNDTQSTLEVLHREADRYLRKAMDSTCSEHERKHAHEIGEQLSKAEKMIKESNV